VHWRHLFAARAQVALPMVSICFVGYELVPWRVHFCPIQEDTHLWALIPVLPCPRHPAQKAALVALALLRPAAEAWKRFEPERRL